MAVCWSELFSSSLAVFASSKGLSRLHRCTDSSLIAWLSKSSSMIYKKCTIVGNLQNINMYKMLEPFLHKRCMPFCIKGVMNFPWRGLELCKPNRKCICQCNQLSKSFDTLMWFCALEMQCRHTAISTKIKSGLSHGYYATVCRPDYDLIIDYIARVYSANAQWQVRASDLMTTLT